MIWLLKMFFFFNLKISSLRNLFSLFQSLVVQIYISISSYFSLQVSMSTFNSRYCQILCSFYFYRISNFFTSIDIAVPLDEFPNLVHTDIALSDPMPDPPPDPTPTPYLLLKVPIVRKSTGSHKPPTFLHDYHSILPLLMR